MNSCCFVLPRKTLACAVIAIAGGIAFSQNDENVVTERARQRQEQLERDRARSGEISDETREAEADGPKLSTKALLPALKGVRLVGNPALISETEPVSYGKPKIVADEGFEKVPPPDETVTAAIESFLGKPVSIASLKEMSDAMIDAYRETDFPLVDVYLPPQNVTTGVIQFVVLEATLGEITVDGAKHSNVDFLLRQMRINPGDRINRRIIEEDLEYLNENPFRRVDLIYKRGSAEGTSDIILKTDDLKPLRVYTEWGNTGIQLTGVNEYSTGLTWGQIGGTEQLLSYNYTTDETLQKLQAHSLFYQLPLENRSTIQLLAAYVTSNGGIDSGGLPVGITGENIQMTVEYHIRLKPLLRRSNHRVVIGADYKSTNNNLIFGGDDLLAQSAEVLQYRTGYEFRLRDDLGYTELEFYGTYSPGNVLANNSDENFGLFREGATADYSYGTVKIERITQLPGKFVLRNEAIYQYSNQPLLSTEQMLAGGYRNLRGLQENVMRGDRGVRMQVELIAPEFGVLPQVNDRLQALVFADAAFLELVNAPADDPTSKPSAFTAGVGLNYRIGSNVSARAAYGWVIQTNGLEEAGPIDDGRFHFGVSVSY